MSYVGIDFDTRAVHLVVLEEDGQARYFHDPLFGVDAFERTRDVRRAMPPSSFWDDIVACGIEEPMGRGSVVSKLNAVQGAILACLPRNLLVQPMRPSVWRTAVGLPGNASKAQVAALVHRASIDNLFYLGANGFGYMPWPQDACDAYCLALAVSRLVEAEAA